MGAFSRVYIFMYNKLSDKLLSLLIKYMSVEEREVNSSQFFKSAYHLRLIRCLRLLFVCLVRRRPVYLVESLILLSFGSLTRRSFVKLALLKR